MLALLMVRLASVCLEDLLRVRIHIHIHETLDGVLERDKETMLM